MLATYKWHQTQYAKDEDQRNQALQRYTTSGSHSDSEDNCILKKVMDYERYFTRVDLDMTINFESFDMAFINIDNLTPQQALCRLRSKGNVINLYKNKEESGFTAFGLQFQTLNKFEMYFLFFKNLKKSLDIYTSNPVFLHSQESNFDELRKIFRHQQ